MSPFRDSTAFIVDGSEPGRRELGRLLRPLGVATLAFDSAEAFLEEYQCERAGFLLLELDLPGMSGPELQARLSADEVAPPVIFVAGEADLTTVVPLVKAGAVDFLRRPCDPVALGESVREALLLDARRRGRHALRMDVRSRIARLTEEERRVLDMLLDGKPNKCIAAGLELSRRTIDFRRASLMKKMQARNLIELAQLLTLVRPLEVQQASLRDLLFAETNGSAGQLSLAER
jgi:FixJ family two-component response regulator